MKTNYYKTREEQKIWEFIKDKTVIDSKLLRQIFPNYSNIKLNRIMSGLSKKQFIKRIIKDKYFVTENFDPHKTALEIYPGYLGLISALRVYNLIDYEDFKVYVITYNKSKTIHLKNYTLIYIALKKKAIGYTTYNGLNVSTIEKTFFDLFYLHRLFDYSIITKAIFDAKNINWARFISYYKKFASSPMCQRTGYLLEILKKQTKIKIPKFVFDYLRSRVKEKTKLINTAAPSKFNKKWLIQDNVGKSNILSWWF